MRPIRARKPLSQVGQKWVGAVQLVLAALSLRTARFSSALRDLSSSAAWAPLVMSWRQQGLSEARNSQDSVLIQVFKGNFQTGLVVLSLPINCGLVKSEFPVKELLWNAVVLHAGDVTCPSRLGLAHDGDGTR